jgi:dUTPase
MLRVKIAKKGARLPGIDASGIYNLYSAEELCIDPTEIAVVSTGLLVSLPIGYYPKIFSGELFESRNIQVRSNSLTCFTKVIGKNTEPIELTIRLENKGFTRYSVKVDDNIAKMVLLRNKTLQIAEVNDFNYDDEIIEQPKMIVLSRSIAVWFKNLYMESPEETIEKYFDDALVAQLLAIREEEEYSSVKNKKMYEISKIWRIVEDNTKALLQKDYYQYQIDRLKNEQTKPNDPTASTKSKKVGRPKTKPTRPAKYHKEIDELEEETGGWDELSGEDEPVNEEEPEEVLNRSKETRSNGKIQAKRPVRVPSPQRDDNIDDEELEDNLY